MNQIFKNVTIPEIIAGMEAKFFTLFNRYSSTGNLNITLFNFNCNENKSIENRFFYKKIYGDSEYIVPASIFKLFSINYFLNIIESNNLLKEKIQIGNEISKKYLNKYLFKIGIKKDQIYDIRELIELALIPSAGDAVYTLSRVVYNLLNNTHINYDNWIKSKANWDNMVNFISNKINEYYKFFWNINLPILDPTGIDKKLVKVENIGLLLQILLKTKSKILDFVSKDKTSIINGRTYNSTNAFVRKDKPFYHPKIIGLKTGSLSGWKNLLILYRLTPVNHIGVLVAGCENHSDTKKITNIIVKELDNKLFNISF